MLSLAGGVQGTWTTCTLWSWGPCPTRWRGTCLLSLAPPHLLGNLTPASPLETKMDVGHASSSMVAWVAVVLVTYGSMMLVRDISYSVTVDTLCCLFCTPLLLLFSFCWGGRMLFFYTCKDWAGQVDLLVRGPKMAFILCVDIHVFMVLCTIILVIMVVLSTAVLCAVNPSLRQTPWRWNFADSFRVYTGSKIKNLEISWNLKWKLFLLGNILFQWNICLEQTVRLNTFLL